MGYYIETNSNHGKADWLVINSRAIQTLGPKTGTKEMIPVCVLDNGLFEAAGIMYDQREFEDFIRPDGRPRVWLLVPRKEIIKLNPSVESQLKW